MIHELVGKSHTFEDGDKIEVFQVKERDGNELYVSYYVTRGPGIPQKLILPMNEFMGHYSHLFRAEETGEP